MANTSPTTTRKSSLLATVASLRLFLCSDIVSGDFAYVSALDKLFIMQRDVTLSDNGTTQIRPQDGVGTWIELATWLGIGSAAVSASQVWFVSAANGNDNNSGITSLAPLKTNHELSKRLAILRTTQSSAPYVVTYLDGPITDELVLYPQIVPGYNIFGAEILTNYSGQVFINFVGQQQDSGNPSLLGGTVTVASVSVPSTNTPPQVQDGARAWASALGHLLICATGEVATVLKDLGGGVAEVSEWLNPTTLATTAPAGGTTYIVASPTKQQGPIQVSCKHIRTSWTNFAFTGTSLGAYGSVHQGDGRANFTTCEFGNVPAAANNQTTMIAPLKSDGFGASQLTSCAIHDCTLTHELGFTTFTGCGFLNVVYNCFRMGVAEFARCTWEASNLATGLSTTVPGGRIFISDTTGFMNFTGSAISVDDGGQMLVSAALYGTSGVGNSIGIKNTNGQISYSLPSTTTITLTSGGVAGTSISFETLARRIDIVQTQTAWNIDPTLGDDANSGFSAFFPIKTMGELARRLQYAAANGSAFASRLRVNILGDVPSGDDFILDLTVVGKTSGFDRGRIYIDFVAPPRALAGGSTFTSIGTNPVPASNTPAKATDTTVANWTANVGRIICNANPPTSDAASGLINVSTAVILKDLTGGVAEVSDYYNPFTGGGLVPANGSAYTILDPIKISSQIAVYGHKALVAFRNISFLPGTTVTSPLDVISCGFTSCMFSTTNSLGYLTSDSTTAMLLFMSGSSINIGANALIWSTGDVTCRGSGYYGTTGTIDINAGAQVQFIGVTCESVQIRATGQQQNGGHVIVINLNAGLGIFNVPAGKIAFNLRNNGTAHIAGTLYGTSATAASIGCGVREGARMIIENGATTPTISATGAGFIELMVGASLPTGAVTQMPPIAASAGGALPPNAAIATWAAWAAAPFNGRFESYAGDGSRLYRAYSVA